MTACVAEVKPHERKKMKGRRIVGIANCLFLSFAVAAGNSSGGTDGRFRLYNVVPMYLDHEAEQAAKCVEMFERTGEDLALYSLTLHPEGKPAQAKVDRYVESYRAFAAALKGTKVRPGVLVQAILGHWPRTDKDIEPWERTIDQDGKTVRFCPLDPGFGAYIEYVFKALAAEHPAFVLTDDDVRAFSHGAECFCKTHVKIFNGRHGTNYDSDGLRAAVAASKPGEKTYDGFFALQREMMHEAVVGRIRRAIDSVDPSVEVGFCIAGEETYLSAPMARRIAAKGQVPVMRCATGCYNERLSAQRFPGSFLRQMSFCELYRGSGIDLLDEADTCPQNPWSKSARSFFTHMTTACFAGMKGAKTWYVNSIRATGIPVTGAYTDVLSENRGFLDALAREVAESRQVGVAIPCFTNRPAWHLVHNHSQFMTEPGGVFETYLAAFGIPGYACRDFGDRDRVFALTSGKEVERMTDAELTRLFSGKVLVLRDAAVALTKRGASWATGVTAEMKPLMFNGERDGVNGTRFSYSPTLSGSVEFRLANGAERLGDLTFRPYAGMPDPEIVAPATVFYRNRLGGEVITMAYHHRMFDLEKFGEGRKRQLVSLVDRLAGGRALTVCENDQDVLTAERVRPDGRHLVLVVNLCSDPIRRLSLRVPDGAKLERLMPDGSWHPADGGVRVGFYEAVVMRWLLQ